MVSRPDPGHAFSEALCPDCVFPCGQAPGRRLRAPAQPPAAWRGVARARLPSWATLHSAPQPGGGVAPHASRAATRPKSAVCTTWGPQTAPFREASGRDAPLREAARVFPLAVRAPSPAGLAPVAARDVAAAARPWTRASCRISPETTAARRQRPMGPRRRTGALRAGDGSVLCPAD